MNNSKILYCDFDGTFIDGDIEKEFVNYQMRKSLLSPKYYILAMISVPFNYLRRKRNHSSCFKSWTFKRTEEEKRRMFNDFLEEVEKTITVNEKTEAFLNEKKSEGYKLILLTGSYEMLVKRFLEKRNIALFDEVIGCTVGKSGFFVERHPYGHNKCDFIDMSKYRIGIANEFADRFYLEKCNEAFVVGDDEKLLNIAEEKKWRRI